MKRSERSAFDISKNVFQLHSVDAEGHVVWRRQLRRPESVRFFAELPMCLVGIEACAGAHAWARELIELGHVVRLMPPSYVTPYVRRQKTDAAAICEAVTPPSMRFVPVKSEAHQAILLQHRTSDLLARQMTQTVNAIRAHLAEFGTVAPLGVGPKTATVVIAAVGNGAEFKNGRHLAAWMGLVSRQHSSGNRQILMGISKRGDQHLRTLLVHGARSVVRVAAG